MRIVPTRRAAVRRVITIVAALLSLCCVSALPHRATAQSLGDDSLPPLRGLMRLDAGRFTVVAMPADAPLARSMLASAQRRDSFPGLPRPRDRVLIAIAPDAARFREWVGPYAPEWGAAVAFPSLSRVVMQGRNAHGGAGDPLVVLRHEIAHLALHESLGNLPPRWFDEGYASWAAGEWGREEVLATNLALVLRGPATLEALDDRFTRGAGEADGAYALAHRAVAELAALDSARGLTLFFDYWRESRSFDTALRRAYGLTSEGFDTHWRQRTRRRYGALALMTDIALVGIVFGALVVPLYVRRRRADRARLQALRDADSRSEARARASAIEALLAEVPAPPDGDAPDRGGSGGTRS